MVLILMDEPHVMNGPGSDEESFLIVHIFTVRELLELSSFLGPHKFWMSRWLASHSNTELGLLGYQ